MSAPDSLEDYRDHDAEVTEARRCLEYAKASAYIRALVESAPPFTAEQRLRVRAILCNPAGGNTQDAPTALYRLYDTSDALLYVGITCNLQQRMTQHAADQPWWPEVARRTVAQYESRTAALTAEAIAIREERPLRNIPRGRQKNEEDKP